MWHSGMLTLLTWLLLLMELLCKVELSYLLTCNFNIWFNGQECLWGYLTSDTFEILTEFFFLCILLQTTFFQQYIELVYF